MCVRWGLAESPAVQAKRKAQKKGLRVGVAFPVSGNLAKIGQSCTNGTEIAKDIVMINRIKSSWLKRTFPRQRLP
ncbi:hypothetical protein [Aneurinibacillus terranovensis]|uniref:hypothetical protein n=1 Tax=Aneurinibacillus terranovensis TaxID=278991 RepID=UPI0012DFDE22